MAKTGRNGARALRKSLRYSAQPITSWEHHQSHSGKFSTHSRDVQSSVRYRNPFPGIFDTTLRRGNILTTYVGKFTCCAPPAAAAVLVSCPITPRDVGFPPVREGFTQPPRVRSRGASHGDGPGHLWFPSRTNHALPSGRARRTKSERRMQNHGRDDKTKRTAQVLK
jgi:hypothetical protein